MRKLILLQVFTILLCAYKASSQDVSIPEGPFKNYLMSRYPGCFVNTDVNGFLMMNTACSAITSEDTLIFNNISTFGDFLDLTGLQYFTSVVYMNCKNNSIQTYVFPPNLKYLDCSLSMADQPFGTLPVLPNSLETLICKGNSALGFTFSPNLKFIDITDNYVYNMPALPATLEKFICKDQCSASGIPRLGTLPSLPASLRYLDCSSNQLSTLPALPASLDTIICSSQFGYNSPESYFRTFTSLPALPSSLKYLDCSGNALTIIPSLPSTLTHLNCGGQRVFSGDLYYGASNPQQVVHEGLSTLPILPNGLKYLNCSGNKLTSLPGSLPPSLEYLNVERNVRVYDFLASAIDGIQCLPRIPATVTQLFTDKTLITCHPNSGSYTAVPARPLCSPVNNVNQCVSEPIISGEVFYDNNSNGIKDPAENYRPYVEVNLSNGQVGYTNSAGYFELTGSIGSNTLTVNNPVYYSSVPPSRNYTISNYTDVVNDSYALQPNVSIDSLRLVMAIPGTARPGFPLGYYCEYENIGTTVVTPQLSFVFDNTRMLFEPTGSAAGATVAGNTVTIPGSLVGPGDRRNFSLNFTVNPTTVLGDTIRALVRAIANTHISTDSLFSVVRGAFDPNDKRATVSLTPQQVQQGDYVNYMVRFQNTGTDTAFNVVVTDGLNALLDPTSFQMLGASHTCKVTRNGTNVIFEFLNILLPDSNVNEPASHGWIRFRAKPISTISLNSVIPNSVAIYFDFNAPVITNTATTTIALAPVPLQLLSFRALGNASNRKAFLSWETTAERNTSYFEIQFSKDGIVFEPCGNVRANGSGAGNYSFVKPMQQSLEFYRLKMVDADGSHRFSQVVKVKLTGNNESILIVNNPVKNMLMVDVLDMSLAGKKAILIDSKGAVVHQFQLRTGSQHIPIQDFPAGLYYLKTMAGTLKIVVAP